MMGDRKQPRPPPRPPKASPGRLLREGDIPPAPPPKTLLGRPIVEVDDLPEHGDVVLGPLTHEWARQVLAAMRAAQLYLEAWRRRN